MTSRRRFVHESIQRTLCRLAFVVFGCAPLIFCSYLCLMTFIPGYARRQATGWQSDLSNRFGLRFSISTAESLSPVHVILNDVRIFLPNSDKLIANIPVADLRAVGGGKWDIQLDRPKLNLEHTAEACRILHQNYLQAQAVTPPIRVRGQRIFVDGASEPFELAEFNLSSSHDSELGGIRADFKIAPTIGDIQSQPSNRFVAFRKSDSAGAYDFGLHLRTDVGCHLLSKLFDIAPAFSAVTNSTTFINNAQFRGTIGSHTEGNRSNYYVRDASISNIDLGTLFPSNESAISGIATIDRLNAKFDKTQLECAQGELSSGPGRVDRHFLAILSHYLHFSMPEQNAVRNVGFDRMAVRFSIWPQWLQLEGIGSKPGIIMEDAQGPLAWRTESRVPILSLVHALAARPDSATLRITPLVRTALVWLPLEEGQRKEAEIVLHR